MLSKNKIVSSLAGWGLLLALTLNLTLAQEMKAEMSPGVGGQTSQFPKVEQPIGLKLAVVLGGLGLIGAELWWFIFSKTKS